MNYRRLFFGTSKPLSKARMVVDAILVVTLCVMWFYGSSLYHGKMKRIEEVRDRVRPGLSHELTAAGFALGDPMFIRVFKDTREMEIWLRPQNSWTFRRYRTYPAHFSGYLGPKLMEGDQQTPEGFYSIMEKALNPNSAFHLSFNIGYPNVYDQIQLRTGSYIMVHGGQASIGCFAMTDPGIEEIYLMAEAAFDNGQLNIPMHIFPFRMTPERLEKESSSAWADFWSNLAEGYAAFEKTHVPPMVSTFEGRYVFDQPVPVYRED